MYGKQGYYSFLIIFYMFVFQFALMQVNPVFNYWDELYAVCVVPLFFVNLGINRTGNTIYRKLIILLVVYLLTGLLANYLYKYQVIAGVLTDVLLQLKFYFGIAVTFYLFRKAGLDKYGVYIKWHARFVTVILMILVIINKIWHIFPDSEVRYGINSELLFFGHPTGLASVAYFLIVLMLIFYKKKSYDEFYIAIGIILVMSSLRSKAIATVLLLVYLYFTIVVFNKKLSGWKIVPIIPFTLLVGWDQFYEYFIGERTMESARGALFHAGIEIARDYFPIGTGLGTFASDPSGKYYSPLYVKYGIECVWGLKKDDPFLVTDTFWPMITGQTGFLGLLFYILIIICLFKMIKPVYDIDKGYYLAGIGALVYLLISSIAESAFVNPLALPLSLIIGLILCRIHQSGKG